MPNRPLFLIGDKCETKDGGYSHHSTVDRAALAPPAAVGGGAFGPTRSVAVSERGHGQHLLQQDLKPMRQLRARAQDLGGETAAVPSS